MYMVCILLIRKEIQILDFQIIRRLNKIPKWVKNIELQSDLTILRHLDGICIFFSGRHIGFNIESEKGYLYCLRTNYPWVQMVSRCLQTRVSGD